MNDLCTILGVDCVCGLSLNQSVYVSGDACLSGEHSFKYNAFTENADRSFLKQRKSKTLYLLSLSVSGSGRSALEEGSGAGTSSANVSESLSA